METIEFQNFKLSRICFGGASISGEGAGYGFGDISEDKSIELLSYAYSKGVNFFDTAPVYGFGSSEVRMGKAFKKIRDKVFICSKAGVDWHHNMRINMSNEPRIIQKMFDESRSRLQSDYIDLYMIHWPDKDVDIRSSLDVLLKLRQSGVIKSLGLCNTNSSDLKKVSTHLDFIQSEYNFFSDGFEGLNSRQLKMGWGSFDKGILSGSVCLDTVFDRSDCRSWAPWWKKSDWKKRVLRAQKLKAQIAPQSLKSFSLEYSLKSMDFSIIGMKSKTHVDSILEDI